MDPSKREQRADVLARAEKLGADFVVWRYAAAEALAKAAFAEGDWGSLERIADLRVSAAEGSPLPGDIVAAWTDIERAAAKTMRTLGRVASADAETSRPAASGQRFAVLEEARLAAYRASVRLGPYVRFPAAEKPDSIMQLYGQSVAWRFIATTLLRGINESDLQRLPETIDGKRPGPSAWGASPKTPFCPIKEIEADINYPEREMALGGVGAVTVLLTLNESGEVQSGEVLAAVPAERFNRAVLKGLIGAKTELDLGEPVPGCSRAGKFMYTVSFIFD